MLFRSRTQSQSQSAGLGLPPGPGLAKAARGSVLVAATPTKSRAELARTQSQRAKSQAQAQQHAQMQQTRLPALFAAEPPVASSSSGAWGASQPQLPPPQGRFGRVDSLNIDTDEEDGYEDDEDGDDGGDGDSGGAAALIATPTRGAAAAARRQSGLSRSRVLGEDDDGGACLDADADADGDEWKLDSSPDVLTLGAPGSQELHASSEDEGPPLSSSPGDLGGFGALLDTPVRRGGGGRGRVLVGDTPTRAR